jgi:hypothetical protein
MKKALLYKMKVTEGVLGHVHGFYREIDELWVPDLNICINREACFESDKPRCDKIEDAREITLVEDDVRVAIMHLCAKDMFMYNVSKLFDELFPKKPESNPEPSTKDPL